MSRHTARICWGQRSPAATARQCALCGERDKGALYAAGASEMAEHLSFPMVQELIPLREEVQRNSRIWCHQVVTSRQCALYGEIRGASTYSTQALEIAKDLSSPMVQSLTQIISENVIIWGLQAVTSAKRAFCARGAASGCIRKNL